jgi:hypothetical protein
LQTHLDQDGAEEWELISTTLLSSRLLLLFKRPQAVIQENEYAQEETTEVAEEQAPSILEGEEQVEFVSEPVSE